MFSSRLLVFVAPAALAATATLTGCKEEDTRLFEEDGVWALERYSLDGGPYVDIAQNRKNLFLLRFISEPNEEGTGTTGVVAAAACHEENTMVNVNGSNCTNAGLSTWTCQCFAYTYEESRMVWQEFAPGDPRPVVGTPGVDPDTDGDAVAAHELSVAAPTGTTATYEFSSLPEGLFNSDGMASKHIFQIKADGLWTTVDKNEDGVLDLEACSQSCFGA